MMTIHRTPLSAAVATLAMATVALLPGCTAPYEDVNIIVNSNLTAATIGVTFVDAATGDPVSMGGAASERVTISIAGPDAAKVIDAAGTTDFKTDQGFIGLALMPGITPSEASPVRFHIVASAPGYLKTSMPINLLEAGGQAVNIPMVKYSAPPKGVAHNSTTFSLGQSGTSSEVVIGSGQPVTDFETTTATVTIPQGTVMRDKDGNVITGTVTANLVYFNNQDMSSMAAFPGGYSVSTDDGQDIFFTTAGFVSLEMAAGNRRVKTFGTPITVTIEVPQSTLDGDGNPVFSGKEVPVWSFDTDEGTWTSEGDAAMATNPLGKLEVSFPVTHLSYWNLDWFNQSCPQGALVNVNLDQCGSAFLFYELTRPNGTLIAQGMRDFSSGSFRFLWAPPIGGILKVYRSAGDKSVVLGETAIPNLCSGTYAVNLTIPDRFDVTVNITARCASRPNFQFRPTFPIWAIDVSGGHWFALGSMVNGEFFTCQLQQGRSYIFGTYYDGLWYESPSAFTVTQNTYVYDQVLSPSTCSKL